jgi:pimeloyl-ACP methyl ester carboxylesterase
VPDADYAAMSEPGRLESLQHAICEGLRTGTSGAAWDVGMYVRAFDFSLSNIHIPMRLFHGVQDRNVPISLVRLFVQNLPTAKLTEFPDDAHLSTLCCHFPEIASALKGH